MVGIQIVNGYTVSSSPIIGQLYDTTNHSSESILCIIAIKVTNTHGCRAGMSDDTAAAGCHVIHSEHLYTLIFRGNDGRF